MKKSYEKPVAEVISFQVHEDLTVDASMGEGIPPWATTDMGLDEGGYTLD